MEDLTREAIQRAARRAPRRVESEVLGGAVYLRYLTSGERDRFLESLWEGEGDKRKRRTQDGDARLVATVWVNAAGESMGFTEADVVAFDGEAIVKLAQIALEMNGLTLKAAEDARKN